MSTTKRRAASAHGKPPTYARPTRASITRTTGDISQDIKLICTRKACSCSENHNLTSRPTPPKTKAMTGSSILGRYPHDRAGRMGRGRGYRPGQISTQAGKGPSQLLQDRIRQLARDIKDKHINKPTEDVETSSDVSPDVITEEQVPTNRISSDSDSHQFGPPVISNANAVELFRARQIRRHRTNSQTVWESEESEDITGDKLSENETESRPSHDEDSVQPSDKRTEEPTPASPPPKHRTRRSAVFEPPMIALNSTKSPRLSDESRTKKYEPVVPFIVQTTPQPESSERCHSPLHNKERVESESSSNSNTTMEETVPLTVEYPPDLPARYRSQGPSIRESLSPSDIEDTNCPGLERIRRVSQSHSDNLDVPRTRFKSRSPSLVSTGAPLLGWAPTVGAESGRSNSVVNISSVYMARRSSVFGLGMNAGYRKDSVGTRSLSNSPTQSRKASVVDIFRRSRQSRNRRLSAYLQIYDDGKERPFARLKRVSKTVRIIAGICLALKSYVKTAETKQWSLIEMHLNLRADMEKTLAFDPIMFSKLRVTRGSEKLRCILSTKSSDRTQDDIDVVLALLRKNTTFADYDRDTQIALAKVMEYLRYEPRRIILKEGHKASGFYIILSGTCLVNQKEIDPRNNETFIRTIDEIHTGDSFGDNELLNDCVRIVSVVCKDECEVLLVNKEDFNVIIREPLERERVKLLDFCRQQDVFEKLPTNMDFHGNNYAISAKKYKPGVVITSDITESDFIYVVQSGKCRVISEVKEIKGRTPSTKNVPRKLISDEEWKKDATLKRTLTVFETMGNRRKFVSEPRVRHIERHKTFLSLSGIKKSVDFVDRDDTEDTPVLPKTLFDEKDLFQTKPATEKPPDKSGLTTTWRRVSMAASAISQKEKRRKPLLYLKPIHLKSTYAEVAVLKEGDVFGIEALVTSSQSDSRLSLLSDGADCIVISKKFFATQATVSTIQQSTKKAIEYPSAGYTLDKIRQARAWSSYKESLVRDVCNRRLSKAGELSR